MKTRRIVVVLCVIAVIALGMVWCWTRQPSVEALDAAPMVPRPPHIHPDYRSLVIPPNIAPLNFRIQEPGKRFLVRFQSKRGKPIEVLSRSGAITIPVNAWHRLLDHNQGNLLSADVYAEAADGQWRRFQSFTNRIATDQIDSHIAYRRLKPDSLYYRDIGIYQRCLETYEESVVLHGRMIEEGCVNCHSFLNYDAQTMTLGFRSEYGDATLLVRDGDVGSINARFGHTAWHPSGRVVAFSRFNIRLFYHTARSQTRDALESDSLLGYYRLDTDTLKTAPPLADKAQLETQPTWSPDGRYLYFVSAPKLWTNDEPFPPAHYADVRYDLKRIRYDVDKDQWGTLETVLTAQQTGKSIQTPRISPDGRFLLFVMCNYGSFALYQPDSDLYLLDLENGHYRKLECNSAFAESWHAWSSNGRWIVFSSKRPTGTFTRLYLCHVDAAGNVSKPFVLPQRSPDHYDDSLYMYSVPEFLVRPMRPRTGKLISAVRDGHRIQVDAITSATPTVSSQSPEVVGSGVDL